MDMVQIILNNIYMFILHVLSMYAVNGTDYKKQYLYVYLTCPVYVCYEWYWLTWNNIFIFILHDLSMFAMDGTDLLDIIFISLSYMSYLFKFKQYLYVYLACPIYVCYGRYWLTWNNICMFISHFLSMYAMDGTD